MCRIDGMIVSLYSIVRGEVCALDRETYLNLCGVSAILGYIHRNAPGPERQTIDAANSQTHDIFLPSR